MANTTYSNRLILATLEKTLIKKIGFGHRMYPFLCGLEATTICVKLVNKPNLWTTMLKRMLTNNKTCLCGEVTKHVF